MVIDGAIVREQGVTFGIVIVKESAMSSSETADQTRRSFQATVADFRGITLILASQDYNGVFSYQGRRDIVDFLASVDPSRIPWMRYSVA